MWPRPMGGSRFLEGIRVKNPFRIVAGVVLLSLAFASQSAAADDPDPVEGKSLSACGKWVLKLADFGKLKTSNYNEYVPENLQQTPGILEPSVAISFQAETFTLVVTYPDQQGTTVAQVAIPAGTYTQDGKRLKFKLSTEGTAAMESIFADLSENLLFGRRALVTDIPYAQLRDKTVKFKGRIRSKDRLKLKFKTRLEYDIQYTNDAAIPDRFSAPGVLKLRAKSQECDG